MARPEHKQPHQLVFLEEFDRPEADGAHFVERDYAEPWIRNKRVLNVGCWTGNFELAAAHLPRRLVALEINGAAAAVAQRANPTVSVINGDVFSLPFREESFDTVLLLAVIEHLGNREMEALRALCRTLRPGGHLILSTPHKQWFYDIMDVAHWLVDHRHYSRAQITSMLVQAGFRLVRLDVLGRTLAVASIPFFYLGKYLLRANIYRNPAFRRLYVRDHQGRGYKDIYLVAERQG